MRKGIRSLWQKHSLRISKISGARAIYESEEIQRVELRCETRETDPFTLEMTPQQCAELIVQLTNAYEAIFPPIRRNRYRE